MIHLQPIENGVPEGDVVTSAKADAVFFVLARDGQDWTRASKVLEVFAREDAAEAAALQLKETFPQRHFGVAVLRSEARHVAKPVEIVRVPPPGAEERPSA